MALTRQLNANRSKQVRIQNDGTNRGGCGDDLHMLMGAVGQVPNEWHYRSLIDFAMNWSGVKRLVKAEIFVKTYTTGTHFPYGTKPKVRVARCHGIVV